MNFMVPSTAADLAVRCCSISKSYGAGQLRSTVLEELNLTVLSGELTFILGPSGCGKTTLLSIIAGILKPDKGHVEILSTPLNSLKGRSLAQFRSRNIGFVLQQFNLLPTLNLVENVAVPMQILGQRSGAAFHHALEALDRVGMSEYAQRHPHELSVGQQQRVAVARAIVHAPRLIICDEPTGSLDAKAGLHIMELLRELALTHNSAVLVVTHDQRATSHTDKIHEIASGSLSQRTVIDQQEAAL